MSRQDLQNFTFTSRYARWSPELGRRETYEEAIDRVVQMHRRHFADKDVGAEIDLVERALLGQLIQGSQRALQFGGAPIERKHARVYNCVMSYCDRPRFFQEALWLLLCGCGVGFSVQHHHIAQLPSISAPTGPKRVYRVDDSIEGWADALGALLSSYFDSNQPIGLCKGHTIEFDYSGIRPKGAYLSSCSGKAPGPDGLARSLELCRQVLDRCAVVSDRLRPIDAYDIMMHASDAVLSGGVRRSATICLFSPEDTEMATAKTGSWFVDNPQRGRSNNSAILVRNQTSKEQFLRLMESVKEFGEPGFVFTDSTEVLVNPCCEITTCPKISLTKALKVHPQGEWNLSPDTDMETEITGWQFCNLSTINAKLCRTEAKFQLACRAAAMLGTLQAAYTRFDYLGPISEAITIRESLLGVSMTGIMDSPDITLDPEIQRRGAELIKQTNAALAAKLGIPRAARTTCVKPEGSVSCLLDTASGIHPRHARRYFRRVQSNTSDPVYAHYAATNPRATEVSVWSANKTDASIIFCVEAEAHSKTKRSVTALALLEAVKLTQQNWVEAGTVYEACAQPWLRHSVSNTISVKATEWEEVSNYIYENRQYFAGISLLPEGGDLDYPQAPFCEVPTYREIVDEFGTGALFASGLIVDGLHAFDDDLWAACACVLGTGRKLEVPALDVSRDWDDKSLAQFRATCNQVIMQQDFIRRAKQFAARYFDGDVRRMTYCLKNVSNCKLWEDLTRDHQPVDYRDLIEAEDNTRPSETIACSGGSCQLI